MVTVKLTKARIVSQAHAEEDASMQAVIPGGVRFEAVKTGNKVSYYNAYNKEDQIIGAVFKTIGKGYFGPIESMAGMTKEGIITAI